MEKAVRLLEAHGLHGRMTGSGSAVFAPMTQAVDVKDAPSEWIVKACENLDVHPLLGWAKD
ncbi:4-diphosphocytidyl-2-C-methyl-D-erythritol kinase [compost metagenome]